MIYLKAIIKIIIRKYLFASLLIVCIPFFVSAQILPSTEYQVKATFIFNFTQFVEWPSDSYPSAKSPLIIGILGDNPFGTYLEETVAGESMNGHPFIVQYYKNIEEIKTCHVLFINMQNTDNLEDSIAILKKRNILTISNGPDFTRQEETIRFVIKNNKIHFQINPEVAKESNLTISSKLLKLSKIFVPQ